jgi:hypothetical protein
MARAATKRKGRQKPRTVRQAIEQRSEQHPTLAEAVACAGVAAEIVDRSVNPPIIEPGAVHWAYPPKPSQDRAPYDSRFGFGVLLGVCMGVPLGVIAVRLFA